MIACYNKLLLILVVVFIAKLSITFASPVVRSFVGGRSEISVEDRGVKRVAAAAINKIRMQHKGERALILVGVEKATVQIVSGSLYRLQLKVGESHCQKSSYTTACKLDEDQPFKACNAEIWEQPWLHKTKVTTNCRRYKENQH